VTKLDDNYKVICIQEITNDMSAILIENRQNNELSFFRCFFKKGMMKFPDTLRLVRLGLQKTNDPDGENSPLKKYVYASRQTSAEKGSKTFMVGIVLRENGRVEFYSDFMQVDEHYDPESLCLDIQTDADLFCLRFAGPDGKPNNDTFKKIPHVWRNRISMSTTRDIKRGYDKWPVVIHRRIARYFKLYSSIANF